MNIQKRLNRLKDILDADRQAQLEKYRSLKKVLKSLRTEKKGLEKRLSDTTNEEQRQELSSRLKVISMQRKKGIRLLKELKEERRQSE